MKVLTTSALGSILLVSTAWAQPAPQYSVKDVVAAFASPSAASPAASACPRGSELGDDGLCEPVVHGRGFSLPGMQERSDAVRAESVRSVARTPRVGAPRTQLASAVVAPRRHAVSPAGVSAGDLLITFKTGSAELTDQGTSNAHAFALALQDPALASSHFEIAGYTDARGAMAKNMALSQARAEAVRSLLVSQGIDASRLMAKGYGPEHPADPANPTAAANRRVEGRRLE